MRRFVVGTVINAAGLWLTTLVIPAIALHPYGGNDVWPTIGSFLLIGAIFGLVNGIIAPIVKVISIPIYILTFGLISFVINGALLIFVSYLSGLIHGGGLIIDGFSNGGVSWAAFGWAVLGAMVMSVATFLTRSVLKGLRWI
ncbi:MAG: phage holin family protein [Micrococcales bacterium]